MATPAQQEAIAQRVAPTTTADAAGPREYVVLINSADDDTANTWIVTKRLLAKTSDEAITKAAGETEGTYVAVPVRNWNERDLAVKTEKKVSLS